jgi:hypothetical protein
VADGLLLLVCLKLLLGIHHFFVLLAKDFVLNLHVLFVEERPAHGTLLGAIEQKRPTKQKYSCSCKTPKRTATKKRKSEEDEKKPALRTMQNCLERSTWFRPAEVMRGPLFIIG